MYMSKYFFLTRQQAVFSVSLKLVIHQSDSSFLKQTKKSINFNTFTTKVKVLDFTNPQMGFYHCVCRGKKDLSPIRQCYLHAVSTMQWKPAFILSNQKFSTIWKIRRKKNVNIFTNLCWRYASRTYLVIILPQKLQHTFKSARNLFTDLSYPLEKIYSSHEKRWYII